MLAKVIAFSGSRPDAARALSSALERSQIHGITTNRDLLVRILRHPEFLSGETDTGFLERHDPAQLGAPLAGPEAELMHAAAAALAAQAERRSTAKVLFRVPSGWRNNPSQPQRESFVGTRGTIDVAYRFDRTNRCTELTSEFAGDAAGGDPGAASVSGPGTGPPTEPVSPEVVSAEPGRVALALQGLTSVYSVSTVGLQVFVDGPDGSSTLTRVERFPLPTAQLHPGSLIAPLPGTIVRVDVSPGDRVGAGDSLVAIEAMKMEHDVRAGHGGVVTEVAVKPGDQVESGRLLVVVEED
jgi:propionyl-CoA carboxylase alpha chain